MTPGFGVLVKILACLALVVGAVVGWNTYTSSLVKRGDTAGYARAQAEYALKEKQAVAEVRAKEGKRIAELQGALNETAKDLQASRMAHLDAERSGKRLRDELSAIRRQRGSSPSPAVAGGSQAADPTGDLLERVQQRLDEAADRIARFADESRIAGQTCERAYRTLERNP